MTEIESQNTTSEAESESRNSDGDQKRQKLPLRKKLLFLGVILVLLVGVPEVLVRIFAPEYAGLRYDAHVTGGKPIGQRGADLIHDRVLAPKSPGTRRYAMLGDSVMWGMGLSVEETIARQAERMLEEARPDVEWECVNLAGMGTTPSMRREYFLEHIPQWNADGVIFQFHMNDVAWDHDEIARAAEQAQATGGFAGLFADGCRGLRLQYLRRSAFLAWMEQQGKQLFRKSRGPSDPRLDGLAACFDTPEIRARWENQFVAMAAMKKACDENGLAFRVYLFPQSENLSDDPRDNIRNVDLSELPVDPFERFYDYCDEYGLSCRHLLPEVKAEREAMLAGEKPWNRLYYILDSNHPNERGAEIFARAIADDILSGKLGDVRP